MLADDVDIAKMLIEAGADVNAKNYQGCTALITAARSNNAGVAKLLIANGADIGAKDNFDWTALMYADYLHN